MIVDGTEVTVAEFSTIRYNEPLRADLFKLDLPADVNWTVPPERMSASTVNLDGPRATASFFFDTLAREDWDALLAVYPATRVSDLVKKLYGGIQVISIGEPFKSGIYPGYFVPYEIRLRDGQVKKFKLAVRNDNRAHRWTVDGGY